LGAPVAALESKEIVCVFRSEAQPCPWSVKTAWGELEQHVAVRDLLIVVDQDFQDDSGQIGLQPDHVPPFSAGMMAPWSHKLSADSGHKR
jgi:hypothetical protein